MWERAEILEGSRTESTGNLKQKWRILEIADREHLRRGIRSTHGERPGAPEERDQEHPWE